MTDFQVIARDGEGASDSGLEMPVPQAGEVVLVVPDGGEFPPWPAIVLDLKDPELDSKTLRDLEKTRKEENVAVPVRYYNDNKRVGWAYVDEIRPLTLDNTTKEGISQFSNRTFRAAEINRRDAALEKCRDQLIKGGSIPASPEGDSITSEHFEDAADEFAFKPTGHARHVSRSSSPLSERSDIASTPPPEPEPELEPARERAKKQGRPNQQAQQDKADTESQISEPTNQGRRGKKKTKVPDPAIYPENTESTEENPQAIEVVSKRAQSLAAPDYLAPRRMTRNMAQALGEVPAPLTKPIEEADDEVSTIIESRGKKVQIIPPTRSESTVTLTAMADETEDQVSTSPLQTQPQIRTRPSDRTATNTHTETEFSTAPDPGSPAASLESDDAAPDDSPVKSRFSSVSPTLEVPQTRPSNKRSREDAELDADVQEPEPLLEAPTIYLAGLLQDAASSAQVPEDAMEEAPESVADASEEVVDGPQRKKPKTDSKSGSHRRGTPIRVTHPSLVPYVVPESECDEELVEKVKQHLKSQGRLFQDPEGVTHCSNKPLIVRCPENQEHQFIVIPVTHVWRKERLVCPEELCTGVIALAASSAVVDGAEGASDDVAMGEGSSSAQAEPDQAHAELDTAAYQEEPVGPVEPVEQADAVESGLDSEEGSVVAEEDSVAAEEDLDPWDVVASLVVRDLDRDSELGQECSARNPGGHLFQDPDDIHTSASHRFVGFRCSAGHEFVTNPRNLVRRMDEGQPACSGCEYGLPPGCYPNFKRDFLMRHPLLKGFRIPTTHELADMRREAELKKKKKKQKQRPTPATRGSPKVSKDPVEPREPREARQPGASSQKGSELEEEVLRLREEVDSLQAELDQERAANAKRWNEHIAQQDMLERVVTATQKEHKDDRARAGAFFGELRSILESGKKYFDKHRAEVDKASWEEMLARERVSEVPVADSLAVLLNVPKPSEVRTRRAIAAAAVAGSSSR